MELVYERAAAQDIGPIFAFSKALIDRYENTASIAYDRVLQWVRQKTESSIAEYTCVYRGGEKAAYYRFFRNENGVHEIDDLYVFPGFQNMGIGTQIIQKCCAEAKGPVYLYVFIRNEGALRLYQRLGFAVVKTVKDSRYIMKKE